MIDQLHHDSNNSVCSSGDESVSASEFSSNPLLSDFAGRHSAHLHCDFPDLSNPSRVFNPIKLVQGLIDQFWNCPSALTAFARKSLHTGTCGQQGKSPTSLWPVPPVRWSWTAASRLGPRRRRRRHFYRIRHELLQIVLISLNWETLGFPTSPPKEAVLGAPFSAQQHAIIERIEGMLDHFLHMSPFGAEDLGRSSEKFQSVINLIQSFPKCKLDVEVLEQGFLQVHESLDPYRSHFESKPCSQTVDDPAHLHCSDVGAVAKASLASAKPVVADRVKWSYPPSFDAQEFLNPVVREAYNDPEVLRKPSSEWPVSRPAKMHIEHKEFLRLVNKWDSLGACMLVDVSEVSMDEAVGIFCVAKDSQHDRLIINPKTINGRMDTITESTKELAPGNMLGLLSLAPDEVFRFQADDLSDFYYTFKVPEKRALRNTFRLILDWQEVQHLQCFEPRFRNRQVAVALKTLAMGDSLAVEIAQQAHCNVLKQLCGSMIHHETLKYRSPVPRTDFIELLAIDDHVGIQRVKSSEYRLQPWLRDNEVFQASQVAYQKVGLIQQEKKRKRNQTSGIILGADFDGVEGKVMGPRNRIAILSILTLSVARLGVCTRKLLSVILGCWIHVLLFRRVFFAVIDQLFKEGLEHPVDTTFCLSRRARSELQLLATFGPLAQSDLRTRYSDKIYCTDASPYGGAVVAAHIGSTASSEIWRHSEQKGFYTRLHSPASEILVEKGLVSEVAETFVPPQSHAFPITESVPAPMVEGILYDCIEIFRGTGNWSSAHESRGLRVHPGIENSGQLLRVADLSNDAVVRELISLALRRVISDWHAGVPCLSFGVLRRPQVRSIQCPAGFDPSDPFTQHHNQLARRTAFIMMIALLSGLWISIEQPGASRMFHLHCYRVLVMLGCVVSRFAFCNFGSAFNKPSKWLHNKPWLIELEGSCQCPWKGDHFVVQGSFTKENLTTFKHRCRPSCTSVYGSEPRVGQAVSSFSAAYPYKLVHQMASGLIKAKQGVVAKISREKKIESFREVGMFCTEPPITIPTDPSYPQRPGHEDPEWILELCDCLTFSELFRYRFKRPGHINVNEARTYKSLLKAIAKSEPNTRFLAILDSRVTIGAASKGRSSSSSISTILRGCIAYCVGGNLYPGLLHGPSDKNPADAPSRDREVPAPRRRHPSWLSDLQQGNFHKFDCVVQSSQFSLNAARWLRFLLLLAGDIEENPGPVRPRQERGPLDLSVGFVPATTDRMKRCFSAFQEWVSTQDIDWENLLTDMQAIVWALRAYGLYCFEAGLPRYMYVYSITAAQEFVPACRPHLSVAWQIDKKWQIHEPGECRSVLPVVVVRAAACVGCLWGWMNWTALFLLGFAAMLHPAEMIDLVRRDLILPSDVFHDSTSLFIKVRNPKTARFARRQHGRVDDDSIIQFVAAVYGDLPLSARLYPASMTTFRKQWNAVMSSLGVPHSQRGNGATPGVLRGSGATYLYSNSEDINWVAWRGRWSRVRTLEYYLQEVGAQMLIHSLPATAKAKIEVFSNASSAVISFSSLRRSK